MPLPGVAANDPLFRNVTTNNWSGQAEALTYQRAIRALENYGMYELIPQLGQKLMQAIGPQCRFVQQYDPFTGEPSVICEPGQPPQDAYGPAMLSVLEYTARMYGVSLVRDTVVWGTCPLECRYTQALNGRSWEIVNSGHEAEALWMAARCSPLAPACALPPTWMAIFWARPATCRMQTPPR